MSLLTFGTFCWIPAQADKLSKIKNFQTKGSILSAEMCGCLHDAAAQSAKRPTEAEYRSAAAN